MTTRSLLIATGAAALIALTNTAVLAQQPRDSSATYGSITPTTRAGTVKLHIALWCPGPTLYDECVLLINVPAGSTSCDICDLFKTAITNDPCCIAKCFTATCEGSNLVVSNCRPVCTGGWVGVTPEGLGDLRLGMDAKFKKQDYPNYLTFYEMASGAAYSPAFDAHVVIGYDSYLGDNFLAAAMVAVDTSPGMTGEEIAELAEAAFRAQGITDVVADGRSLRFDTPASSAILQGVGLRARWSPADPSDPDRRALEVFALPDVDAIAFADAKFDIVTEGGSWSGLEIMAEGATGDVGVPTPNGVTGISVKQVLIPGVNPAPDQSSPLLIWRGVWQSASTDPRCIEARTSTHEFRVFSRDPCEGRPVPCNRDEDRRLPGSPPEPALAVDREITAEGSDRSGMYGADCRPADANYSVLMWVNDDGLGYSLSPDRDFRCTTAGTDCEPIDCLADFDHSGFVDIDDFISFAHAFEAGIAAADVDHSGFVDLDDYAAFLAVFEAGC